MLFISLCWKLGNLPVVVRVLMIVDLVVVLEVVLVVEPVEEAALDAVVEAGLTIGVVEAAPGQSQPDGQLNKHCE